MVHKLVNIEPTNSYTNRIFILLFFFSAWIFFLELCYAQYFENSLMIHISLFPFFLFEDLYC